MVSLPPRPSVVMLKSSSMPWKPATMTILPSSSMLVHPLGRDRLDAGLRVRAIGAMPICPPVRLTASCAEGVNRHRHQRDAHLLAGREEHVHLAGRRAHR